MNFEVVFNNKTFYVDFNQEHKKFFKIWICDEENMCKFFRVEKEKKEFVYNRFYYFKNFDEFYNVFFNKIPMEKLFN